MVERKSDQCHELSSFQVVETFYAFLTDGANEAFNNSKWISLVKDMFSNNVDVTANERIWTGDDIYAEVPSKTPFRQKLEEGYLEGGLTAMKAVFIRKLARTRASEMRGMFKRYVNIIDFSMR